MPFNVWCLGCERHIARGVRFNAEKKQIAKHHSTPIYSFRMKCPSCSQWIEIHTDPKNAEYQVVSGARRKVEDWEPGENEAAGLRPLSPEEAQEIATNPFARLEHEVSDQRKAAAIKPHLAALKEAKDAAYKDDWAASQRLRKQFRVEKAAHQAAVVVADDIRKRGSFDLKLLPEQEEDIKEAESVDFVRRRKGPRRSDRLLLLTLPKLPETKGVGPLVKRK